MGSLEFNRVISNFPCKRIGVTATPNRSDNFKTYLWSIGMRKITVETTHQVKPLIIGVDNMVSTLVRPGDCMILTRKGPKSHLPKLITHLYSIPVRNARVIDMTQRMLRIGRHIILLTHRREAAQYFFEQIQCNDKILRLGAESKSKKSKAEYAKHHQLVVATAQFMTLAFDMPRLDTLINTGPYSGGEHGNDVKQAVGRILRSCEGKPRPVVIDMYDLYYEPTDDGRMKPGFAYNMYRCRLKHYKAFDYEIVDNVPYTNVEAFINTRG